MTTFLSRAELEVALRYGESLKLTTLDFADAIMRHGRRRLYLRLWLEVGDQTESQQTVFFTAPRFLNLRRAPVQQQHTLTARWRDRDRILLAGVPA